MLDLFFNLQNKVQYFNSMIEHKDDKACFFILKLVYG
jgi:hypothetical protein